MDAATSNSELLLKEWNYLVDYLTTHWKCAPCLSLYQKGIDLHRWLTKAFK